MGPMGPMDLTDPVRAPTELLGAFDPEDPHQKDLLGAFDPRPPPNPDHQTDQMSNYVMLGPG